MATTGARSSAIMAAGTLVSRILGFLKTMLLAVAIGGATNVGDVFALANTLPNQIYVLVAAGVFNAVLVPQVIKASKHPDGGADYISRLLSLAVIGLFAVTALVVVLARPIISVMASGWSEQQIDLGVTFALWCFPQIFFYGLYTVVGQILNARGAFGAYMWAPALNNVVAIGALLVFVWLFGTQQSAQHTPESWTSQQTFWLAGMATVGVALQALILFIPLKALKIGLGIKLGWRGIGLRTAGRLASWTLATGVIANLAFLYVAHLATTPAGFRADYDVPIAGNNALDNSTMLYQLPHGVIGLSVATVLFNQMSRSAAEEDRDTLIATLSRGQGAGVVDEQLGVLRARGQDGDPAAQHLIPALQDLVARGRGQHLRRHLVATAQHGAQLDSLRHESSSSPCEGSSGPGADRCPRSYRRVAEITGPAGCAPCAPCRPAPARAAASAPPGTAPP